MRHTLLFISSVALAAVLATTITYADDQADTAKQDQTPEQSADTTEAASEAPSEAEGDQATEESGTESGTESSESETTTSAESSDSSETPASSDASDSAESSEATAEEASDTTATETADASVTPSEGAAVYIIYPSDGSEVTSPVKVVFGLDGLGIAPAGVDVPNTGHHHLIIDGGDELPAAGEVMGDNVMHFGGGQTETDIELEPGEHTLQLILGDKDHKPFEPSLVSEKIKIKVVKP